MKAMILTLLAPIALIVGFAFLDYFGGAGTHVTTWECFSNFRGALLGVCYVLSFFGGLAIAFTAGCACLLPLVVVWGVFMAFAQKLGLIKPSSSAGKPITPDRPHRST
jgi:hypothetical protein